MDDDTKAAFDSVNARLATAEETARALAEKLDAMAADVRHALANAADTSGFSRALRQLAETVKRNHETTFGPGSFVMAPSPEASAE